MSTLAKFLDWPELIPFVTDIRLQVGMVPWINVNRKWAPHPFLKEPISAEEMMQLLKEAQAENEEHDLKVQGHELDFAFSAEIDNVLHRFRGHESQNYQGFAVDIRVLKAEIDALENLGFSPNLGKKLLEKKSGLIIVGGPTGSGKSTTLSSLVYEFGKIYQGSHIVTLEDPVEYILSPEGCLVTQKQVPVHVRNWEDGIHQAKREKPDLIVIGELRSKDAIRAAVEAAGSGHLVMATMFADRVPRVFEAIKDAFEAEELEGLKQKLSYLTRGVICQALVPTSNVNEHGYGQPILVSETLVNDVIAVESSLRKGTWGSLEIRSIEGQSASSSWETRIDELLSKGTISKSVIEYLKNK